MSESEIAILTARLLADPNCHLAPASSAQPVPESFPEDVRQFFAQCAGGGLFYSPDALTPQFGCLLGLCRQPITQDIPCEGEEFDHFYSIAEYDEGEYDHVVVSTLPATYGQLFRLSYSLGDPVLTLADARYQAPSLTRWLAIHVEVADIYAQDWREGLKHFERLLERERHSSNRPSS